MNLRLRYLLVICLRSHIHPRLRCFIPRLRDLVVVCLRDHINTRLRRLMKHLRDFVIACIRCHVLPRLRRLIMHVYVIPRTSTLFYLRVRHPAQKGTHVRESQRVV